MQLGLMSGFCPQGETGSTFCPGDVYIIPNIEKALFTSIFTVYSTLISFLIFQFMIEN